MANPLPQWPSSLVAEDATFSVTPHSWLRNEDVAQSTVSILFTHFQGCGLGNRKMPMAICASAAKLPSIASLGCLP